MSTYTQAVSILAIDQGLVGADFILIVTWEVSSPFSS